MKFSIGFIFLILCFQTAAQPRVRQFEIPIANPYGRVQSLLEYKGAWYGHLSTPCDYGKIRTFCDNNFKITGNNITLNYVDSFNTAYIGFSLHKNTPMLVARPNSDSTQTAISVYELDENLNVFEKTRFYPADTNVIIPHFYLSKEKSVYIFSDRYLFFKDPSPDLGSQPWITKLDSNYNVEWEKALPVPNKAWQSFPTDAIVKDGKIMASFNNHLGGIYDIFWSTLTIDDDGSISNAFALDTFTSTYHSADFTLTNKGEFVIGWRSYLPDEIYTSPWSDTFDNDSWYLKKLDRQFKEKWRVYMPVSSTFSSSRIITAKNGDIIILGTNIHLESNSSKPEQWYPWIARFTENGEILWSRIIENNTRPISKVGTYGQLLCGFEAKDGRIVVGGSYIPDIHTLPWVYELDSMGCLTPGCTGFRQIIHPDGTVTSVDEPSGAFQLQQGPFYLYPNPIQESFTFENTTTSPVQLQVFNLQGQLISSHAGLGQGIHRLSLPPTLAPGVYIWQAVGKNGVLQSGKLQKE